jgi:hypothetical protein
MATSSARVEEARELVTVVDDDAGANRLEAMSRSGLQTARQYTWQRVLERHLLPCIGAFDGLAGDALRVA